MALGYDGKLYILAFDHRGSFQKKMFGIEGAPNEEQTRTISDAKRLIFEGFRKAVAEGAPKDGAGILVDEQFGADIVREAEKEGFIFAMPVEKSGQNEFDFEYGDDFGKHIEDFNPTFSKVLVRFNPEGDQGMNERQTARLKKLSDWLHAERPQVPVRALGTGGAGAAGVRRRRRGSLRQRGTAGTDGHGHQGTSGRRCRARHLEDRRDRRTRGLRAHIRAGAFRRP